MIAWAYLTAGIAAQVAGMTSLRVSDGLRRLGPTVLTFLGFGVSVVFVAGPWTPGCRWPSGTAWFWPGGGEAGAFYAYPGPAGFAQHPVVPDTAHYNAEFGQFLLPYEVVRAADDPDRTLLNFLHATCTPPTRRRPRQVVGTRQHWR